MGVSTPRVDRGRKLFQECLSQSSSSSMFWRALPSDFLLNFETSSVSLREFLVTSCSSVAALSCPTNGPYLIRSGATREGLGETEGARSPSSISSLITPFLRTFLSCCWSHKVLIIFIIRGHGMIWLYKGSIIFVFRSGLCMSWICCFPF